MLEMTMLMFPIVCTEKAMKDLLFQKGYQAHIRALAAMKEDGAIADSDYDTCLHAYSDSYDTSETQESAANLLWWFLIFEVCEKNQWMIEGAKALIEKRVSNEAFLKNFYLRDCSIKEEENSQKDVEQTNLEELDQAIIELLKELKKGTQYSSLADYYIALRYVLGCADNELTEAMNRSIGEEMMWSFMRLGNKYAKNFILKGIENFRK